MPQVDAPFEIGIVGGHILQPDLIVDAETGPTDHRDHVVAGRKLGHVRTDLLDLAKALVADDQEVEAVRGGAVLRGIDLFVRSVDADTQNPHQDSPAAGDLCYRRFGHFSEVNAVRLAGIDGNCSHLKYLPINVMMS